MKSATCNWCGNSFEIDDREVGYFCSIKCANTSRNKGLWQTEEITEEALRWHYELEQLSTRKIAEIYGVSKTTVTRKLKKFNIRTRTSTEARHGAGYEPPNEVELRKMYEDEYMSYQEIAREYGVDHTAVPFWLDKFGIPKRHHSETRLGKDFVEPTEAELRHLYEVQMMDTRTMAEFYGVSNMFLKRRFKMYGIEPRTPGFGKMMTCSDGHVVRSHLEYQFDEKLYEEGISHEYEVRLPFDKRYSSDFYCEGVYVEIWGMQNNESYEKRKRKKRRLYKKNGLTLLDVHPKDFINIDNKINELKRLIS